MKTTLKTLNKSLEKKLAYYTIHHANELIYWLNEDSNFLFVNDTFCKRLNIEKEEVLQMHPNIFFPEFDMKSYRAQWKKLMQGGAIQIETLMRGRNQRPFPVELNATLIGESEQFLYCGIVRDITLRKKYEIQREVRLQEAERVKARLQDENIVLRQDIYKNYDNIKPLTRNEQFKIVLGMAEQVAATSSTVLITGETGTGKELIANMVHREGPRSEMPFLKLNCAALTDTLIESELFGHEMGAFTGAIRQKKGRFELADEGTLFLDEISELSQPLQAKLLRVIQEGTFERVGGEVTLKVDVRLIAATNRNLEQHVRNGNFREDLYYRLNVFPIHCIPLRERTEDIEPLVNHFTAKYSKQMGRSISKIPRSAIDKLKRYDFPGNVRELENIIERAVILSNGIQLKLSAAFSMGRNNKKREGNVNGDFQTMEAAQKQHIIAALKKTKWKVSGSDGAAKLLAMHPKTLWSRMKKLDINPSQET